ncbi:MAG: transketolase C-terminal domain-containing protein [Chloroflexota bacterium]
MRIAFINALAELAKHDSRILLLTSDLGYMVIEPFAEQYPDRFINVGVAEQNMVGVATGLADAGFVPFIYSITPFAVLRPFEFIRNGPVYHQLPVRIIGVGQGVEYGFNGNSHFGLEDVGVLRTQPGLTIIAPADDAQTKTAIEKTSNLTGPVYFRLSKDSFEIPELSGNFELGQTQQIGNGMDVLILSTGAITREVIQAAQLLSDQGLRSTILVIASIAPAPVSDLIKALSTFKCAFTVESHYITGGIGSLVAEIVADHCLNVRVVRLGFDVLLNNPLGSSAYLQAANGLSPEKIASRIQKVLEESN